MSTTNSTTNAQQFDQPKKPTPRRPRQTLTLTPDAEVALKEALEVLRWDMKSERTFFANLALKVVSEAVVKAGSGIPMPLAVDLRLETPEETMIRLACRALESSPDLVEKLARQGGQGA